MRRTIRIISASVLMLGLNPTRAQIRDPKETSTNFRNYRLLAAAVRKADRVLLYEGLPHPWLEQRQFMEEQKSRQTVELHDFQFYAAPLELKETDAKKLTDLYCNRRSFKPFSGPKACGGFHPDYLIEWHVGEKIYRAQICFTCHEMKSFGPGKELYCDISDGAYEQLHATLKPYHKNRPGLRR